MRDDSVYACICSAVAVQEAGCLLDPPKLDWLTVSSVAFRALYVVQALRAAGPFSCVFNHGPFLAGNVHNAHEYLHVGPAAG